ncbi:MAG: HAD family hydrolase [Candidatus Diapherotrites archaeon]|nr:HAD family hydrolase [Candidatus Diapherotrites archaeon]MDZ4255988.1 HAD family hydrolase [archaeon]
MNTYAHIFGEKRLIIFDIDGTMMDTVAIHMDVLLEAYQRNPATPHPDPKILQRHLGKTSTAYARDVFRDHGHANPTLNDIQSIIEYHRQKATHPSFLEGKESLFPGVRELLERLRQDGKELAVISGNIRETGEVLLQATGIISYFKYRVYASDTYLGKPIRERHEMLRKVLEQVQKENRGLSPRDTLVIGDTMYDIEAAHQVGMEALAVGTGNTPLDELKTHHPLFAAATLRECLK